MSIYQRALKHGVQRLITKPRLALPVLITLSLTLAAVLTVVAMSSNLIFKPLPDIKDEQNIYHVEIRWLIHLEYDQYGSLPQTRLFERQCGVNQTATPASARAWEYKMR